MAWKPTAPMRPPTMWEHTVSSKLRDENNIDKTALNVRKAAAPTAHNISPSVEDVKDEEAQHTFEHPHNPEWLLELSDRSNNDEVAEVTAHRKQKNQHSHSGQAKACHVEGLGDEGDTKDESEVNIETGEEGTWYNSPPLRKL